MRTPLQTRHPLPVLQISALATGGVLAFTYGSDRTSKMSMAGWWIVHAMVRPVLTMLRTTRMTMAAALASRPAATQQRTQADEQHTAHDSDHGHVFSGLWRDEIALPGQRYHCVSRRHQAPYRNRVRVAMRAVDRHLKWARP